MLLDVNLIIIWKIKLPVFRLPKAKDVGECKRWVEAIPRENIPITSNTLVCAKHFPVGYETIKVCGKFRPTHPPSVFDHLPKSLIPTPPPDSNPRPSIIYQVGDLPTELATQVHDKLPWYLEITWEQAWHTGIASLTNVCILAEPPSSDLWMCGNPSSTENTTTLSL
jgi:hypothetical protein